MFRTYEEHPPLLQSNLSQEPDRVLSWPLTPLPSYLKANPSPTPSPLLSLTSEDARDLRVIKNRERLIEAKLNALDSSTGNPNKAKTNRRLHVNCLRLAISLKEVSCTNLNFRLRIIS